MLALIATVAGLVSVPAAEPPTAPVPVADLAPRAREAGTPCKAAGRYETDWAPALLYRAQDRLRPGRLADLPKPNEEKAVMRTVGGCVAPLVVSAGVGR